MKVTLDIIMKLIQAGGSLQDRRRFIVALGEIQDPSAVPILVNLMLSGDEEYGVRLNCASALGKIGDKTATDALMQALANDENPQVREVAATALGKLQDPKAVSALVKAVKNDDDDDTREMCVKALGRLKESSFPEVINVLSEAVEQETDEGVKFYLKQEFDKMHAELLEMKANAPDRKN